jgi:hypothetical protein
MASGPGADNVPPRVRDEAPSDGDEGVAAPGPTVGGPARALDGGRPAVSRAPCALCGVLVAVNRKGGMTRVHQAPETSLRCAGSGHPPAKDPEQIQIPGA